MPSQTHNPKWNETPAALALIERIKADPDLVSSESFQTYSNSARGKVSAWAYVGEVVDQLEALHSDCFDAIITDRSLTRDQMLPLTDAMPCVISVINAALDQSARVAA